MFLEKRVYQGSSGRVYPLAFTDRVAEHAEPRPWEAVLLENEYLLVMVLPELGGRIHRILDKTNGYDAIYHQPVIKPALVGLAGPWCSGGIELNWPQHHRPSTFLPADVAVERHPDGAATVWLGEHEPMARMKGMHGVRLHPGRSVVELVVRLHNRTADVQTFLWWANAATRVHEGYQSFFPPDVTHVADHAKRAVSTFPHCSGSYYGVNYGARARHGVPADEVPSRYVPPHSAGRSKAGGEGEGVSELPAYPPDDLTWYANIPVPTSYMCLGTEADFFGGYDHRARAGIMHVASHHIAPGKKQWTWGNHAFGYAWDRNLTDPDPATGEYPPYIELMAGVFTDNQPDFSFLHPGETRTWSQFWYPFREIGPALAANVDGAISLRREKDRVRVGVAVTAPHVGATVELCRGDRVINSWVRDLAPDRPLVETVAGRFRDPVATLGVRVRTADGRDLVAWTPPTSRSSATPAPATEPPVPRDIAGSDELYLAGLHLEQYRHATRRPEDYWREALRRDPGDSRCNLALGRWHLRRGEFDAAEHHLRASIERLTARNPNPYDGEPYYQLGRCLRHQAFAAAARPGATTIDDRKLTEAADAFHKATWNHAWQAPAFLALAEIDAWRHAWSEALAHLDEVLRRDVENLRARNLRVIVLRRLGREDAAAALLQDTLRRDPLDWWARQLAGEKPLACDNQVRLDLALDCVRAGLFGDALAVLDGAEDAAATVAPDRPNLSLGTAPLVHYYRAWISHLATGAGRRERTSEVKRHLRAAAQADPAYCFPARLEEIAILGFACTADPRDARAPFYLGNLLYDRRRHREAIRLWQRAVAREPGNAIAWRNLGIGCFNVLRQPQRARRAYERAFQANPRDARLLYERDQLWKRLGRPPAARLRELERHRDLVTQRDDLSVELCALYNQTGRPELAQAVLAERRFQPWEGGEGQTLAQHVRTHLALGRRALAAGRTNDAIALFQAALDAPANLGEAKHPLANQSDIHYWLGCAEEARGDRRAARTWWHAAARARGDFQEMSVRAYSELTYYAALALQKLGRAAEARRLLRDLLAYARRLARTPARIDYFATSLPAMLLFEDDLDARQQTTACFLEAQARHGLGETAAARRLLQQVLRRDPNHALAADLLAALST